MTGVGASYLSTTMPILYKGAITMTAMMKNLKESKMYYGDVAEVAAVIGVPTFSLWNSCKVWLDMENNYQPFTTDLVLLRRLCKRFPTATVRLALGL